MKFLSVFLAVFSFSPNSDVPVSATVPVDPETPALVMSFMVSEDYAEINWSEVTDATAYKIEIRKSGRQPVRILEDKTVWTSFYFRVAEPGAAYEFRLAVQAGDQQSNWTPWQTINTANVETPEIAGKQ